MKQRNGFTLVELMVAIGVTMGLLAAVYLAINSAQRHSSAIEKRVAAQQDAKPALDLMMMEIGMASYNPNRSRGNWLVAADCLTVSANQANRGIQEATTTAITVEMDINQNCLADSMPACMQGASNPNGVIRYNYVTGTGNQYITRTVNCLGGAQPFLGDTGAPGRPRTVRVINEALGIPVFRYFDGTGTEIFPTAADQTPVPNIRRIEIVLAVETEHADPDTGQRRRLIYSTSVIPRNHAI